MKVDIVIGAGYGDEGKGYFTDYISSKKNKSVVIRFNGGAQAGHTVTTPDNKSHVFGHFTSNLFLDNSSGYLSKYFQLNPIVYLKELNQLNNLGINPEMACHDNCYVSTPYDMLLNQWLEKSRGEERHGSCGLGIGETIHRSEVENIPLFAFELKNKAILKNKLQKIKKYFETRVRTLGLDKFLNDFIFCLSEDFENKFIQDCNLMLETLNIGVNDIKDNFFKEKDIVFEGAQGLMLDQYMGEFPFVTRSNTGLKNVVEFCIENNIKDLNVIYATRCYKTRHGAGPMKWTLDKKPYENIVDLTNMPNEYQGTMRFAYLDLDVLNETIHKDIESVEDLIKKNNLEVTYNIGITWLNISNELKFYHKNKLLKRSMRDFVHYIEEFFEWNVLSSIGKTRKDVKKV